ncbi:hypothetical protein ACIBH1_31800 [Nonomuraea sp. NPDC050663]|uniref:hypothetical protein n=1 Tax=Nonomuraea sp. NPDC050663 TaxID=3364370 RepID=UPI00378A93D1
MARLEGNLMEAQLSDEARRRFREAAEALAAVVMQHAETLCAMEGGQREVPEIFSLNDRLSQAAGRFKEAQFDLTGTYPSFDVTQDEDDWEEDHSDSPPAERIAILMRHDFVITDQEALLKAGRAAYLQTWPDDIDDDALFDVQTADRAVYQLLHASGQDQILRDVPGLSPTGGVQATRDVNEPLDFAHPFAVYYDESDEVRCPLGQAPPREAPERPRRTSPTRSNG